MRRSPRDFAAIRWFMRRAVLFALLVLHGPAIAGEPTSSGEIVGRVLERSTKGEKPVPAQTVRLRIVRGEAEIQGAETSTNANGVFRFRNLNTGPDFLYVARVEFQGAPYTALPARFSDVGSTLRLPPFKIYPATPLPNDIEASEMMGIEFGKNDVLKILETLSFLNRGDKTYSPRGERGVPIEIPLLRGGFDLNLLAGVAEDEVEIDPARNLLLLRKTIPPGDPSRQEIRFSYSFPYRTRALSLAFPMNVARTGFNLILRDKSVKVQTAQLQREPSAAARGGGTLLYSGGPFGAGETIRFEISGLWPGEDVGYGLAFAGILGVTLAALWILLRRPGGPREEALDALAALEKRYRSGSISEAVYEKESKRLREWLFDLWPNEDIDEAA